MVEKFLHIPTKDGKVIYGTLNYKGKKPARVIVFVHGLTGSISDHPLLAASRFFPQHGFAAFRIGLYGWNKDARHLRACTTKTHGKDISRAVQFLKKDFQNVFLVGHSWGLPSILFSNTKGVKAISFWDGSVDLERAFSAYKYEGQKIDAYAYNKSLDAYVNDFGVVAVVGKKMVEESRKYPKEKIFSLLKRVHTPLQYLAAGEGILKTPSKNMFHRLGEKNQWKVIPGAHHSFEDEGKDEVLFRETLKWFKSLE